CVAQIAGWSKQRDEILAGGNVVHTRTHEYASYIFEALITGRPFKLGGNVINNGLISNLPPEACVEVPCFIDKAGIHPTYVGKLPTQLAMMNSANIYAQLLTIEAAVNNDRQTVYQAAMADPHTGAELSTDEIVAMCDELLDAHEKAGYPCLHEPLN
ncbi:MAG: alpha-glucosidase/alpha-galactosidase, partial [Clostridia bacterium]|nr:alpha-glucosidase/alpha-galactosidase [Clostridia bacterium]